MKACKNDFYRKGLTRILRASPFVYGIWGECGMIFTGLLLRQFCHGGDGGVDFFLGVEH